MILDKIVEVKKREIADRKQLAPLKKLEQSLFYETEALSLVEYLNRPNASGIIAEIKRKSPSKGLFKKHLSIEDLSIGYMQAGASALSVLTDEEFFGGSNADLTLARRFNLCPILRKDFVLDEYQIHEAKSIGADVILLIARILTPDSVFNLAKCAHSLGLEVLLEIHDLSELADSYIDEIDLLGINNRDLNNFNTSIERSHQLITKLPKDICKISESGINTVEDIKSLRSVGYQGFLMGERFMRCLEPALECSHLIRELNNAGS
jgi:indole-3-glycerol phosphate synthase